MLEMNEEIRAQWCAALRSGEYVQVKGHIRLGDTYCCLGVLTDLYVKQCPAEPTGVWDHEVLDSQVTRWAGFSSSNPELENNLGILHLAAIWNDEFESTFPEIADMIDGGQSENDSQVN